MLAVAALARHRPWDAALVALSPVVATGALVSLDLVAVALAVLGVLAFSRERPVLAGVLVGLAVTTRPLAVVVLLALVLLAVRTGRWAAVGTTGAAAVLAWLLTNVPVLVLSSEGWGAYWSAAWSSPPGYGSLWLLPRLVGDEVGTGAVPPVPGWVGFAGVGRGRSSARWCSRCCRATCARTCGPRNPWVWLPVLAAVVVRAVPARAGRSGRAPRRRRPRDRRARCAGGPWSGYAVVLVAVALLTLSAERRPRLPAVVLLLLVGVPRGLALAAGAGGAVGAAVRGARRPPLARPAGLGLRGGRLRHRHLVLPVRPVGREPRAAAVGVRAAGAGPRRRAALAGLARGRR